MQHFHHHINMTTPSATEDINYWTPVKVVERRVFPGDVIKYCVTYKRPYLRLDGSTYTTIRQDFWVDKEAILDVALLSQNGQRGNHQLLLKKIREFDQRFRERRMEDRQRREMITSKYAVEDEENSDDEEENSNEEDNSLISEDVSEDIVVCQRHDERIHGTRNIPNGLVFCSEVNDDLITEDESEESVDEGKMGKSTLPSSLPGRQTTRHQLDKSTSTLSSIMTRKRNRQDNKESFIIPTKLNKKDPCSRQKDYQSRQRDTKKGNEAPHTKERDETVIPLTRRADSHLPTKPPTFSQLYMKHAIVTSEQNAKTGEEKVTITVSLRESCGERTFSKPPIAKSSPLAKRNSTENEEESEMDTEVFRCKTTTRSGRKAKRYDLSSLLDEKPTGQDMESGTPKKAKKVIKSSTTTPTGIKPSTSVTPSKMSTPRKRPRYEDDEDFGKKTPKSGKSVPKMSLEEFYQQHASSPPSLKTLPKVTSPLPAPLSPPPSVPASIVSKDKDKLRAKKEQGKVPSNIQVSGARCLIFFEGDVLLVNSEAVKEVFPEEFERTVQTTPSRRFVTPRRNSVASTIGETPTPRKRLAITIDCDCDDDLIQETTAIEPLNRMSPVPPEEDDEDGDGGSESQTGHHLSHLIPLSPSK